MMTKDLNYYLGLNYPFKVTPDSEVGWFAKIPDLPGCWGIGPTVEAAIRDTEVNKKIWIEMSLEDGSEIPEPRSDEEYSGQFLLRLPKSLHHALAEEAKWEGVSMNQYVVTLLTEKRHIRPVKKEKIVYKTIVIREEKPETVRWGEEGIADLQVKPEDIVENRPKKANLSLVRPAA
jgi:antitoxin HicB